ncbi:DUF3748 domain-containing protein [Sphingobacterium hotanense]|uniref:DUF3748 domain-containing protein n=1 Tax=Sphingobacterium hotanense TaxID=649196 RepID=UPI0011F33142|nr:DUF3748 domain-containing protein [Sphingobacterium hotanense]
MPEVTQLTHEQHGHSMHHNGAISSDGNWIVFDYRNDDTHIGRTGTIAVLDRRTGSQFAIYQTLGQSIYGPGVGAASFNPCANQVVFIHGLLDADKENPYDITRRTAVIVDLENKMQATYADSRDLVAPYAAGSLRGGTHSHMWSPDGKLLSFTYNDELVDPQLRVVGLMFPVKQQDFVEDRSGNVQGTYYAVIVSDVTKSPQPGSDEINKAFDECWVKSSLEDGDTYCIAFQGNTVNASGETITEIFLVDVDLNLAFKDKSAVGMEGERPKVPQGIRQKRLSRSPKGLSNLRHWLRASPDGKSIYALAKDQFNKNQIVQCNTNTGELSFVSNFDFSVASPINIDASGEWITFTADNNLYVFQIHTKELLKLTDRDVSEGQLVGAPLFDVGERKILYNQFIKGKDGEFIQIKMANY